MDYAKLAMKTAADHRARAEQEEIALRKNDFETRFNKFISAVASFAEEYNATRGNVWPAKKAEAMRKAMKAVADTEPRLKN